MKRKESLPATYVIPLLYVAVGWLYILLSDRVVVALFQDAQVQSEVQTYKGFAFIAITAVLLHLGIRFTFNRILESKVAVQRSESMFRGVFESNMIGILFWKPDGSIIDANNAFLKMTGYDREDLAAGKVDWETITPEEFRSMDIQAWEEIKQNGFCTPIDKEFVRKDGSHCSVLVGAALLREKDQLGVAFVIDNTERKRSQEEIKQLAASLEKRVEERTQDLRVANRELESFSYSVSHDLRAPLRSLSGFSHALLEDYGEKLDEEGRDYLNRIKTATERMTQLLEELLRFSRVSTSELSKEHVDLSEMARVAVQELQAGDPQRKAEIEIQPNLTAVADPTLIQAVLSNLLTNSWKFSARNEITKIQVGENEGVFFVRDNGVGFSMEYAQKIFEPFQRLHPAHEFPGSGIGLATVKRIVDRHGGKIWAESHEGQGATFYFSLPEH